MRSHLLEGKVRHRRVRPVQYALEHDVYYFALDLAELETIDRVLRLVSRNRRNLLQFRDLDHWPEPAIDLQATVLAHLRARGEDPTGWRITLVTNLRVVGYVFNPASFYLCRDAAGELRVVIVEVHNTHLERHLYTLRPRADDERFVASMAKAFYVSPFIGMDGEYTVHVRDEPSRLSIAINERYAGAPLLATSLVLERRRLTTEALEIMQKVDTLVTDKTGTLTEGKPKLTSLVALEGFKDNDIFQLGASLERASEHPLAAAIVKGAEERNLALPEVSDVQSVSGKGITGLVGGRKVAIGNQKLFVDLGIALGGLLERADALRAEGQTVMFVAVDGKPAGLIGVADPIKESTVEAVRALHAAGLQLIMITGDSRATAEVVAHKLGIDRVFAEVMPEQKAEIVKQLQAEGRVVAMAGDGINDAPALAQAQVGIAMGTGTDVAMESAGVTLIKGDLRGIVRARLLSQATMRNIRQNLFFAFIYNMLGVPVAAGLLYPFFGLLLSPMIAAAAMSFSSVSVIGNALRLNRIKL